MDILIPILIIIVICVMLWGWSAALRRIPLQDYGKENVERILELESPEYRNQVLQRGWLTNKEWARLMKKHPSVLAEHHVPHKSNFDDQDSETS